MRYSGFPGTLIRTAPQWHEASSTVTIAHQIAPITIDHGKGKRTVCVTDAGRNGEYQSKFRLSALPPSRSPRVCSRTSPGLSSKQDLGTIRERKAFGIAEW